MKVTLKTHEWGTVIFADTRMCISVRSESGSPLNTFDEKVYIKVIIWENNHLRSFESICMLLIRQF